MEIPNINFPNVIKTSAKSIAMDLVDVKPMDLVDVKPMESYSLEKYESMKNDIVKENRSNKIDSVLVGKPYIHKSIEDHPDFKKNSITNPLFFTDYVYTKQ